MRQVYSKDDAVLAPKPDPFAGKNPKEVAEEKVKARGYETPFKPNNFQKTGISGCV